MVGSIAHFEVVPREGRGIVFMFYLLSCNFRWIPKDPLYVFSTLLGPEIPWPRFRCSGWQKRNTVGVGKDKEIRPDKTQNLAKVQQDTIKKKKKNKERKNREMEIKKRMGNKRYGCSCVKNSRYAAVVCKFWPFLGTRRIITSEIINLLFWFLFYRAPTG